jgi:hypothetical protein
MVWATTAHDVHRYYAGSAGKHSFGERRAEDDMEGAFPLWLRANHFINLFCMFLLIRSGIQILAHHRIPRLLGGRQVARSLHFLGRVRFIPYVILHITLVFVCTFSQHRQYGVRRPEFIRIGSGHCGAGACGHRRVPILQEEYVPDHYYEVLTIHDLSGLQTIPAYAMNGKPMPIERGAPCRLQNGEVFNLDRLY